MNLYTKKSQWDKPTAPATPASEAQSIHTPQQQPAHIAPQPAPQPAPHPTPQPVQPTPQPVQSTPPAANNPPGAPEVPAGWAVRFNDQYKTW